MDPSSFDAVLAHVEKPCRYVGNERGAVRKDVRSVTLRFALAFPDVYEIAQSHLGLQILYDILNSRRDTYAERVYAPWPDLERLLRTERQPLVSLETRTPLSAFHIVGFTLQYELTYTNVLMMLDLGGIPLLSSARKATDPLVVAGGPCAFNPEPIAGFLDAVLLGDGEEAVHDICDTYLAWDGKDRFALLTAMAAIPGMYVPALYEAEYSSDGRFVRTRPRTPDGPVRVKKRVLPDLNRVPLQRTYVVPTMRTVHARPSVEVMRGCVKGCRFCQAGYIYRPLRERDPRRVLAQAELALAATGADELSLLSLSTGDYSCVNPLLTELMNRLAPRRVALSLPSTRVDALAKPLLEQIRRVRKTGFTLAPEAGTQRLRDVIQKQYSEEELLEAAREIFAHGWQALKLYFMLGLPTEGDGDIFAIADLCARVAAQGSSQVEVTASVSTFVPRPHTPFQWLAQIGPEETARRQDLLRRELRRRRVRFRWHDSHASVLEGIFSRGDRRLGSLLLAAYRLGCRFDGWSEVSRADLWECAMKTMGVDPADYLRARPLDEALPWDHLYAGVEKAFLLRELSRALERRPTPDCSIDCCSDCGACDFRVVRNIDYHVDGARGAEHRGRRIDLWARVVAPGTEDAHAGSWEPRGWRKLHGGAQRPPAQEVSETPAGPPSVPARVSNPRRSENTGAVAMAVDSCDPVAVRARVTYSKLGPARFIGHLDLIEALAAAFRRAELPLAFSQGYHPLPRFRFSPGLPVGCESDCEVLDVDLTRPVDPNEVARRLAAELPEGLDVLAVRLVPRDTPPIENDLIGMRYQVDLSGLLNGGGLAFIDRCVARFLETSSFIVRKRTRKGEREIDVRPLVARVERVGVTTLQVDLRFGTQGSIKPLEFVAALLELDPATARALPVRKTMCFYRSGIESSENALLGEFG